MYKDLLYYYQYKYTSYQEDNSTHKYFRLFLKPHLLPMWEILGYHNLIVHDFPKDINLSNINTYTLW